MITKNEISSLNLSPTKKDFVQIWNELIEVASKITERWDPTSTNESDPGIVLLKVLTGIADKLNYNIDKNILEAYMPTAAQMESMRKLCELVGYDIRYYQSAETQVTIRYIGNTKDKEEKLPETGLAIPKFTTITNAEKDITFVTTNTVPAIISNSTPWVEVPCIEGQISQCESTNENNLITLAQLTDENRYYLPEIQIAENGIFVYSAVDTTDATGAITTTDGTPWVQVSNLNTQASNTRVFKFGYDSFEGRPYLAFPADIGSLIGDGLFIYFVRTSGLSGNISPRTLEVIELPTGGSWSDYSADKFEVVNVNATTNGANIENISTAYNNFKKTVGTFDTLVTCRDYMNKIYSLMDASNSPYVSNILVTDIRNDINNAFTLCSCNEYGILYKETPLTTSIPATSYATTIRTTGTGDDEVYTLHIDNEVTGKTEAPLIDHFDLLLYPFKTFNQVSSGTTDLVDPYNTSFTYTEHMNREIEAALADLKTCAHNLTTPVDGDVVAINNYLRLNALIATSTRVSTIEAENILQNVKVALVNAFNLRNLDFGEEIPFDSILSVIENADPRIKVVSLQEPVVLTTYSVKNTSNGEAKSKEYGIATTTSDGKVHMIDGVNYDDVTPKGETAKNIYNRLVLRNILAGRASLFDYEETFATNNAEKPYTATKNITDKLSDGNLSETEKEIADLINEAIGYVLEAKQPTIKTEGIYEYIVCSYTRENIEEVIDGSAVTVEKLIEGDPIMGFDGGIITVKVRAFSGNTAVATVSGESQDESTVKPDLGLEAQEVFETYEPLQNNIIQNIKSVEAVCEIHSKENTFKNIKLSKNEVIKFRAPNLITTKTFPAYVYYHFERAANENGATGVAEGATDGSYAEAVSLNSFISSIGIESFFSNLWSKASKLYTFTAKKPKDGELVIEAPNDTLTNIFNTAIAVRATKDLKEKIQIKDAEDNITYTYRTYPTRIFTQEGLLRDLLTKHFEFSSDAVTFEYYPLSWGTQSTWGACIKDFTSLPTKEVFWKLSSTSSYPKGKLVLESGKKLIGLDGESLALSNVGELAYICTHLGSNPEYYTIAENSDIALKEGDKLYIHYTPSSTNEDGETEQAEPISIVYEGGDPKNPVIIKPSGFTLVPSNDVNKQGTSWKKTDVDFGTHGLQNLLSLAPNEQIELRSVSKVIINTPARFYKNFDHRVLDNGNNSGEDYYYELQDGEYLFYTDQNTQEAAYYGSGSVITLAPGTFIPTAKDKVEVSQILEKGLHIIPWSDYVILNDNKKITITEYQYVTLTADDTLDTLTVDADEGTSEGYSLGGTNTNSNNKWIKCISTSTNPIKYTPAGSETSITLPRIDISNEASNSWEVCSFLELSTSPNYSQQLRMTNIIPKNSGEAPIQIKNKLNIYSKDGTKSTLEPSTPEEPISIKLSTLVQSASGNFEKIDTDLEDGIDDSTMQMKIFKEEAPSFIALSDNTETITPISKATSNKIFSPVDASVADINNYWAMIEIDSQLSKSGENPAALNLNFMLPTPDTFGIFSIYLAIPEDKLDSDSLYDGLKDNAGVFIEIPKEHGLAQEVISIFNYEETVEGQTYHWWPDGVDSSNRLYLRAGLNCIKVHKSCNLLIKAEQDAAGSLLYDNMRLVKGRDTNGINLTLLDPNATYNKLSDAEKASQKVALSDNLLTQINSLDKHHDFYYNTPIENSLAIEFDDNISAFSHPQTLYDINNVNNTFVVSKLDVKYLKDGLKIAKSSRY
jgi:hypothetical protein